MKNKKDKKIRVEWTDDIATIIYYVLHNVDYVLSLSKTSSFDGWILDVL